MCSRKTTNRTPITNPFVRIGRKAIGKSSPTVGGINATRRATIRGSAMVKAWSNDLTIFFSDIILNAAASWRITTYDRISPITTFGSWVSHTTASGIQAHASSPMAQGTIVASEAQRVDEMIPGEIE